MIQANELRIKNLVRYKFHDKEATIEISANDFKILEQQNEKYKDRYNPIPLTEKLLIELGAERIVGWDGMIIFRINHKNMSVDIEELEKGFENDMGMVINNVHEYQNYVFYTIGKEITKQK